MQDEGALRIRVALDTLKKAVWDYEENCDHLDRFECAQQEVHGLFDRMTDHMKWLQKQCCEVCGTKIEPDEGEKIATECQWCKRKCCSNCFSCGWGQHPTLCNTCCIIYAMEQGWDIGTYAPQHVELIKSMYLKGWKPI